MAKLPPNLPKVCDFVKLRGKGGVGFITRVTERNWAYIAWEPNEAIKLPAICHLYELEKIVE